MIHYALICDRKHEFEGWFNNSADYDKQAKRHLVSCPVCGSTTVVKQLMTPGIPAKSNQRAEGRMPVFTGRKDEKVSELVEAVRKLRRQVEENADYVGDRFAEEARRIHYNEVKPRGIYGEASLEEAKALLEEGVEVHPLPPLPEEAKLSFPGRVRASATSSFSERAGTAGCTAPSSGLASTTRSGSSPAASAKAAGNPAGNCEGSTRSRSSGARPSRCRKRASAWRALAAASGTWRSSSRMKSAWLGSGRRRSRRFGRSSRTHQPRVPNRWTCFANDSK